VLRRESVDLSPPDEAGLVGTNLPQGDCNWRDIEVLIATKGPGYQAIKCHSRNQKAMQTINNDQDLRFW
jgi:hypothetical protein